MVGSNVKMAVLCRTTGFKGSYSGGCGEETDILAKVT